MIWTAVYWLSTFEHRYISESFIVPSSDSPNPSQILSVADMEKADSFPLSDTYYNRGVINFITRLIRFRPTTVLNRELREPNNKLKPVKYSRLYCLMVSQ